MQKPKKLNEYLTRAHCPRKQQTDFRFTNEFTWKMLAWRIVAHNFFFSSHHKQTPMHDIDDLAFVKSQKWFFFGCKSKLLHKWAIFSFTYIEVRPETYEPNVFYRMRRKKKMRRYWKISHIEGNTKIIKMSARFVCRDNFFFSMGFFSIGPRFEIILIYWNIFRYEIIFIYFFSTQNVHKKDLLYT